MGQRHRHDGPGIRHHVMNRGIAKRTLFGGPADYRAFLAQIACASRRGLCELEAFCLMPNHLHLLLRTEAGTLSGAMRRIQNGYSRWFNRRNRRDGPLFRGRFRSKPVLTTSYVFRLLRYFDFNPVQARLAHRPQDWPWGSCRAYLEGSWRCWLSPTRVTTLLTSFWPDGRGATEQYARLLSTRFRSEEEEVIDLRLDQAASRRDALDQLEEASEIDTTRWMIRKAKNADGLIPALAVVAPISIARAVARSRARLGDLWLHVSRKRADGWAILEFGLQHESAGQRVSSLASRHGVSVSTASKYVRLHRRALLGDDEYARVAGEVQRRALDIERVIR